MPPADKASVNRSPCVIVKLLCVTIAVYTAVRQPVVFFPRFSRALSVPHLSEDASPVGGSAKGNGIRDNHRGRQPLGSSPRPFSGLGFAGQSVALLRSASCLPFAGGLPPCVFGARLGLSVRFGALVLLLLGKGVCTTMVDTLRTFNYGEFCFCQGRDKCFAPLTKTLFWCVSPINRTAKLNICRAS